jgi:hypothetical protein
MRGGSAGEDRWVEDMSGHFRALGIHWSYWPWKAVKNHMFPDGIYSYGPNDPWVNRQGPLTGWETWAALWPKQKKAMIASWRTDQFSLNKKIAEALHAG